MQSDETAPETIPNAIGMAKVRRVESPNSSETATIVITATKVVREGYNVSSERGINARINNFTDFSLRHKREFSRTRS